MLELVTDKRGSIWGVWELTGLCEGWLVCSLRQIFIIDETHQQRFHFWREQESAMLILESGSQTHGFKLLSYTSQLVWEEKPSKP